MREMKSKFVVMKMFAEVEAELRGFLILAKDKGDW
jgi:hypothetical protein